MFFNFCNWKSGVDINQSEGKRLNQEKFWGRIRISVLDVLNLRHPTGGVRWEVGDESGVEERGFGAGKEVLTWLCDHSPIPFPLWASIFP